MKFYEEGIAKAVQLAKEKEAIFVVFCAGKDESSKKLADLIETDGISCQLESQDFVAIKIDSDQEAYTQFARIYQLVPVPSIFFIKNGIPMKIVTSAVKTEGELKDIIDELLRSSNSTANQPVTETASQLTDDEAKSINEPTTSGIVCEGEVCYKKSTPIVATETTPTVTSGTTPEISSPTVETEAEKQEKIKLALKLIEQKRIERIKQEKLSEKENEIRRRKEGQEVASLKKWQEEQEFKQVQEENKREKEAAKAARARVLSQIEQDKKERASRFGGQQQSLESQEHVPATCATTSFSTPPNSTRIQFKRPDGSNETCTFDVSMPFQDLHAYVKESVLKNIRDDFTLALSFPRREFTQDDFDKKLSDLNLTPSAVLLIIYGKRPNKTGVLPTNTDGGFLDMIGALLLGLFSPISTLFTYLKNLVFKNRSPAESPNETGKRKRNEDILTPNDAAKKRNLAFFEAPPGPSVGGSSNNSSPTGTIPKSAAYKRPGASNIHRLHENGESDEEDKKTYNGNSTQQM